VVIQNAVIPQKAIHCQKMRILYILGGTARTTESLAHKVSIATVEKYSESSKFR